MNHISNACRKAEGLLFLATGQENYGVLRTIRSLTTEANRAGIPLTILTVEALQRLKSTTHTAVTPTSFAGRNILSMRRNRLVTVLGRLRQGMALIGPATAMVRARKVMAILVQSPALVLAAGLIGRRTNTPVYWLMPNAIADSYPFDLNKRLYRLALRRLSIVALANSAYTASTLGHTANFLRVLHLGADPAEFDPNRPAAISRDTLGIAANAVVFGLFARLAPEKGQAEAITALSILGQTQPGQQFCLLLCGGPLGDSEHAHLAALVAGLPPNVSVIFRGPVDDVASHYSLIDVALNLRTDAEPFGFSVIEAMAMGVPVLAHRLGGPSETIDDGQTGWLAADCTPETLAMTFNRAFDDRPRWPAMGAAARAAFETRFTSKVFFHNLMHEVSGMHWQQPAEALQ